MKLLWGHHTGGLADRQQKAVQADYVFLCGEEMRSEFDIHPLALVITRRRPAQLYERYLAGKHRGTFLLTPEDRNAAAFLPDLPWME